MIKNRKTTMASKDSKHKNADGAEEEVDDNGNNDDGDSSSTNGILSELEEEEMNLLAGFEEHLLIW
jgi:hypothetical protein